MGVVSGFDLKGRALKLLRIVRLCSCFPANKLCTTVPFVPQ